MTNRMRITRSHLSQTGKLHKLWPLTHKAQRMTSPRELRRSHR
jgi:hypothetical protein